MAVVDRPTLNRVDRNRLLRVLNELCEDLEPEAGGGETLAGEAPPVGMLTDGDEQLVAELRAGLERLAGFRRGAPGHDSLAVQGALDGAEFIARGDIVMGQSERLPQLLPSFVFLVSLPLRGRPEALRLAERAAQMLDCG